MSAIFGWVIYDFVYLDKLFSVYCYVCVIVHGECRSTLGDSFHLICAQGYSLGGTTAAVAVSGCRISVCQQQETATMQGQFPEAHLRDSIYFLSQFQWINNR